MKTYTLDDLPANVAARTVIAPESGCWRCSFNHDRDGYARIGGTGAHRVVYTLLVGPIEPGLVIDHVAARGCIWRDCIFPDHLEPVTSKVNSLRGRGCGAINAAKTKCDNGHEFTQATTYITPSGTRQCRPCNTAAVIRYKKRQRANLAQTTLAAAA